MIRITVHSDPKGAKNYFDHELEQSEYYLGNAQELRGVWHGRGSELLGLHGEVERSQFHALCDGLHPFTKQKLTPRMKMDRRVSFDFTVSAPKSVSLAYEIGKDERVLEAFQGALRDTMSEMETAMMTRIRRGGVEADRYTGNMVWSEFIHKTARPVEGIPDPHLHAHAVAFNVTYDMTERRWKAGQFSNLVRDKFYYQSAFNSRLADRMQELGYGIERDGNTFKLAGITRETCEAFSRRTELIEAEAKRRGIVSAKEKGDLGRITREKKVKDNSTIDDLRKAWVKLISSDQLRSIMGAKRNGQTTTLHASDAMDYALAHSFERASVLPEKKLLAEALIQSYGTASVSAVKLEALRDSIIKRDIDGQRYVTTREVLAEEIAMVDYVRNGRGLYEKLGDSSRLEAGANLSKEQRVAAETILNSRDAVVALKGGAGAGKTHMLPPAVKAIEAAGRKVYAFASWTASVDVLRKEGFKSANTVAKLLTDAHLQQETRGQVLLIDEASQLSVKDMKQVIDLAKRNANRVILCGDWQQLGSVERGDSLRILHMEAGMKTAVLSEVRRQRVDTYRKAVSAGLKGSHFRRFSRVPERLSTEIGHTSAQTAEA